MVPVGVDERKLRWKRNQNGPLHRGERDDVLNRDPEKPKNRPGKVLIALVGVPPAALARPHLERESEEQ